MIDANSQFFAILTNVGMAKQANADALGVPWKVTDMGVGDANGTDPIPEATQTRLINEWRRRPLNQLKVDPLNPAIIIAEQVIPADEGGKWIREIGLYDADGDLVAVANCAPSFKPILSQGSGRTQVVRMNLIVSNTGSITLKIDPSVVLATRDYVDTRVADEINKLDRKQSVRAATTANIVLVGAQVIDGIAIVSGDRVLVKNQTQAKDNGIYVAAVGAWSRAKDADNNAKVTPNMMTAVEVGATQADTIWQLISDGLIVIGTTALTFQDVTAGFARLLSPGFAGNPTAPTPAQFNNSNSLATTEFVKRMGMEWGSFSTVSANTVLSNGSVGSIVNVGSATPINLTFPPTAPVASGGMIEVVNGAAGTATLLGSNGEIFTNLSGSAISIVLGQGDSAILARLTGEWRLVGGSVALKYSSVMAGQHWVTQPQFDNTKAIATTEFVQRAMGNYRAFVNATGSMSLTAASIGAVVTCIGTFSVTLPLAGDSRSGSAIHFRNIGSGAVTVVCAGADAVNGGSGQYTTLTLPPGTNLELVSNGAAAWWASGSAQLALSSLFACSLGATGWRRLPSGEIEQWGLTGGAAANVATPITFPVAFLNACVNVQMTYVDAGTQFPASRGAPVQVGTFSKTGFSYSHSGSSSPGPQHFWTARGY